MPVIQLDRIEKSYFGNTLFQNLNLKIEQGERLALLGENGTGKTTLLRLLAGVETPDFGERIGGDRLQIGMLSQTLDSEDPNAPVWQSQKWIVARDALESSLLALEQATHAEADLLRARNQYQSALQTFDALGGYQYEYELKTACAGLGLPEGILQRTLGSCSGGEKMRISLAKLLLSKPDLLLLDEPTNHLDLQAIEWLIEDLKRRATTLCVVSHDRYFLDQIASRCLFLEHGTLRSFTGNYTRANQQKQQEDQHQQNLVKSLQNDLVREREVTQTFLSHRNISGYHSRQKRVLKLQDRLDALQKHNGSKKRLHFTLPPLQEMQKDRLLLRVQDLCFTYDSQTPPLLNGINLSLKAQDKIALIGPNGCGKSTLLNLLQGTLLPDAGKIELREGLRIGRLDQEVQFDPEATTCLEVFQQETEWDEKQSRNRLAQFGFTDTDVFKHPSVLSGGERARLALCCCLAQSPELLFLDEPTNHLDILSKEILEQAIQQYPGAVFVISHDRYFVSQFSTRFLAWTPTQLQEADSLEAALQKCKRQTPLQSSPTATKIPTPATKMNNPVQRRKAGAKLQQTAQKLQKQLETLQAEQLQLETDLTGSTDYQLYQRLADLQQEIEVCETEYLEAWLAWEEWKTGSETTPDPV